MAMGIVCEAVTPAPVGRDRKQPPRLVERICRVCERPFSYVKDTPGTFRKECSPECRAAFSNERSKRCRAEGIWAKGVRSFKEFACKRCGEAFQSRQTVASFCGPECNNAHHSDLQRAKGEVIRAATAEKRRHTCQQCGADFVRRAYGKPGENKYCSPECRHLANRRPPAPPKPKLLYQGQCARCDAPFSAKSRATKHCSDECRAAATRDANRKRWHEKYTPTKAGTGRDCVICAAWFEPRGFRGKGPVACSPECAAARERQQLATSRAKQKARKRAATVEAVNPFKVFERDGWRCQLCRCKTPRAKRGTLEPNAPELDHIVPLSKGGEHSYRNTQCLCRACNQRKSDRDMGQLLLFG